MSKWPVGESELARAIREADWSANPLGPISGWSNSLKTVVDLMLCSKSMMSLVWGPEAIHLYNDAFAELLTQHLVQSVGRSAFVTFARQSQAFVHEISTGMQGVSAQFIAKRYPVLRNGQVEDAWFDGSYGPVRDESGQVAGVLWIMVEATNKARAVAALRQSEERHRLMIESWTQAVWETDAAGVVVADSPSWRAYTGQTLGEWLNYGWLDAIHPDDRAYAERQWREAIDAHRDVDAEFRLRSPGGGWRWTNVRAAPVLDEEGRIEKWVVMNIDIDSRKRAEAALRESEENYRSLFETMGQGYAELEVIRDANGHASDIRYLNLNPAYERLTGISVTEARGRTVHEVIPDFGDWWVDAYDRIVRSGEPNRLEYLVATLDRWYEAFVYPRGGDRFTVFYEEITARKKAEVVLRESAERQAYLLRLSDALRTLGSASDISKVATCLLGMQLGAARVLYGEIENDEFVVGANYVNDGVEHITGRFPFALFGSSAQALHAGRHIVVDDVGDAFPRDEADNFRGVGVQAVLSVPLVKDGRLVANLNVHQERPRHWSESEVALVQETAERTWAAIERGHAEAALRESEEKYRSLYTQMGQGYIEVELIRGPGGDAIDYRYLVLNPAYERLTGIPIDRAVGRPSLEVIPDLSSFWAATFQRIVDNHVAEEFEYEEKALTAGLGFTHIQVRAIASRCWR